MLGNGDSLAGCNRKGNSIWHPAQFGSSRVVANKFRVISSVTCHRDSKRQIPIFCYRRKFIALITTNRTGRIKCINKENYQRLGKLTFLLLF